MCIQIACVGLNHKNGRAADTVKVKAALVVLSAGEKCQEEQAKADADN